MFFSSGIMLSGFLFVVSQNIMGFFCIVTKCKVKFMFVNRVLETRNIYLRRSPVRAPRGQVTTVLKVTLKDPTLLGG